MKLPTATSSGRVRINRVGVPISLAGNFRSLVSSSFAPFSASHSHTTTTAHPFRRSSRITLRSRSTFRLNLASQNARFRFGVVARAHPSWRCQKQPCTNTAHFLLRFARSGEPGRPRLFSLYRRPMRKAQRRTSSSAKVPVVRTAAIRREVFGSVPVGFAGRFITSSSKSRAGVLGHAADDVVYVTYVISSNMETRQACR